MEELTQAVTLARNKLDGLAPSFPNTFRNLPVVDFIDPSIEVRQVLVRNVTEELNFAQVPRIDRCQTCHLGIDNPDYADAPQPFTTHPNLDMFVSRESDHPVDDFGCTSCHLGRGRKLSFSGATHMPESVEEEHAWMEQYGWKEDHYWDNPMYQANLTEAGCIKCHRDQVFIPGAQQLNQSRMTYELSGCWGCHNTAGYEDKRNRGPSLKAIAHKTDRDFVARWIRDPKAFRQSTWMPTFWNLDNNPDSELRARNDTEVAAIVEYVFEHSTDEADYAAPPRGNAERGEALANEVGCLGCHLTDENGYDQASIYRRRGPALVGTGTKAGRRLRLRVGSRIPRHYWEETYMPDLRLTNQEAADITAWLMGLEAAGFAAMAVPRADAGQLDELTREFLRTSLPDAMAADRLAGMSEREKLLFSGEWLIRRHGCFGCHEIGGFEDAQKIGVDLSTWGSKMVTRPRFRVHRHPPHPPGLAGAEARRAPELRPREGEGPGRETPHAAVRFQRTATGSTSCATCWDWCATSSRRRGPRRSPRPKRSPSRPATSSTTTTAAGAISSTASAAGSTKRSRTRACTRPT